MAKKQRDEIVREIEWASGFHINSKGEKKSIKELPTPYLQNIVNKYRADHDVSVLEQELISRPQDAE